LAAPNFELEEASAQVGEVGERLISDLPRRAIGRALIPFDLSGHVPIFEVLRHPQGRLITTARPPPSR